MQKDSSSIEFDAEINWLEQYQDLIEQLSAIVKLMEKLFALLKGSGLSQNTIERCKELLVLSDASAFFKQAVMSYLYQQTQFLDLHIILICCSDVIESCFGKYKFQQSQNPSKGITPNCINIANYGKKLSQDDCLNAMQDVKIRDLQSWKKKNQFKTKRELKKQLFKKVA